MGYPQDPNDAATKAYVDSAIGNVGKLAIYRQVLTDYEPTFWISGKFPRVFSGAGTSVQDLSGNGLSTTGTIEYGAGVIKLGTTSRITSTSSYTSSFTLLVKAKKINPSNNRILFSSNVGNRLLGWWGPYQRCAWMDTQIFGVTSNQQAADLFPNTC